MRGKLWTEIAGRADPSNPSRVIAPSPELLNELIDTALRIEAREARLLGPDAPTRPQISPASATFAQPITERSRRLGFSRHSFLSERLLNR
jgi:hypothetical protein